MQRKKSRRLFRFIPVLGMLLMSGCTAVSTSNEGVALYKNSIVSTLCLFGIGVAFLVFGIGIAKESYEKRIPKKRSKKRRRQQPKAKQAGTTGIVIGSGLTLIGVIIIVLGVPSSLLAYVEVGPKQVVIRDQLYWFATGPKTFSYANISDIEHEELVQIRRRGKGKKEILYISHAGGVERIDMAMIHKAARGDLEERWRNFRSSNPITPGDSIASGENIPEELSEMGIPDEIAQFANPESVSQEQVRPMAHRGENNQVFTTTVTGKRAGSLFGTKIYTDDSDLAVAAVHAGVLKVGETGAVSYRILPGQQSYSGAYQYGVKSSDWNAFPGSFEFVSTINTPSGNGLKSPTGNRSPVPPQTAPKQKGSMNSGLTPVEGIGRIRAGKSASAKAGSTGYTRAEILEVYAEGKVKVRYTYGDLNGETAVLDLQEVQPAATSQVARSGEGPGKEITDISQVSVGMKLLGFYDGDWYPVEVKKIRGNKPVVTWEGERGLNAVPLSWLRISE